MDPVTQLSLLGIPALAGIRLYATVFLVGLLVRFQWLGPETVPEPLQPLGSWAVIVLAGILLLIEFVADKIAWIDSLWDALHTLIRPVAGVALGVLIAWGREPEWIAFWGLLGGAVGLSTHTAKASMRAGVNLSPEPVSNVLVSLAEDLFVFVGVLLVLLHPVLAILLVVLVLALAFFSIRLFARGVRGCWRRLWGTVPGGPAAPTRQT